jgi:hypothetical protein
MIYDIYLHLLLLYNDNYDQLAIHICYDFFLHLFTKNNYQNKLYKKLN